MERLNNGLLGKSPITLKLNINNCDNFLIESNIPLLHYSIIPSVRQKQPASTIPFNFRKLQEFQNLSVMGKRKRCVITWALSRPPDISRWTGLQGVFDRGKPADLCCPPVLTGSGHSYALGGIGNRTGRDIIGYRILR